MTEPHVLFNITLHGHQPVGNLQQVMEWCYEKCYGPFLELMARHSGVRFTYHLSGCLLEWLQAHRPEHLDLLREMVDRGQVELLGGAFYEPIMASIPRRDAWAQIQLQRQFYRDHFGADSNGIWLAERVWEPGLPSLLARAGVEYTMLDDTHFRAAGLAEEDLHGYFLTEDQGQVLALFPILKSLRYTIPFGEVDESLRILRDMATQSPGTMLAYGDDVEKFGVWPETFEHCYENGWLEEFVGALEENRSWLRLVTLSETVSTLAPRGLIYPPETSYVEMNEWALPAALGPVCARIRAAVEKDPDLAPGLPFVRGSSWRNFKVKYPEIRRMYGRSLHISRMMAALPDSPDAHEARRELYRGQCNCPYWHGVFGGHYLPHLREGVWRHLIEAERRAEALLPTHDEVHLECTDIDLDGRAEAFMRSADLGVVLTPRGGRAVELDLRPWGLNLFSVLARRPEAYHDDVKNLDTDSESSTKSIHDIKRTKDPDVLDALHYDRYEHLGFSDLLLTELPPPERFLEGEVTDEFGLHSRIWDVATARDGAAAVVTLSLRDPDVPLCISKTFHLHGGELNVRYALTNPGDTAWRGVCAVEIPVALQTGSSPRRVWRTRSGEVLGPLGVALTDVVDGIAVADWDHDLGLHLDAEGARVLSYAVKTVSQSEAGFEGVFQHAVIVCAYDLDLEPGAQRSWEMTLTAQKAPVSEAPVGVSTPGEVKA